MDGPPSIPGDATVDADSRQFPGDERHQWSAEAAQRLPQGLWVGDLRTGKLLFVNPALAELVGVSERTLYDQPFAILHYIHPEDRAWVGRIIKSSQRPEQLEYRILRADGAVRWVCDRCYPVCDEGGQPVRLVGVVEDITDRKSLEGRLSDQKQWFHTLIRNSLDLITIVDRRGVCTFQSPASRSILDIDPEQLMGRPVFDFVHHDDVKAGKRAFRQALKEPGTPIHFDFRARRSDGTFAFLQCVGVNLLDDPDVGGVFLTSRDVTRRSLFDPLTGLPNRAMFVQQVEQLFDPATPEASFSLILLDIDRLSDINESLGHHAGDLALTQFASRIRESVRQTDVVARFESDAFAVLVKGADTQETATAAIDRIHHALSRPISVEGHRVAITVSAGVTVCQRQCTSPAQAIGDAETALHRANRQGQGQVAFFDASMRDAVRNRVQLENDLRTAIAEEELEVYYQPIVTVQSGAIVGMEALVRWISPSRGFVSPGQFIPVAEQLGIIGELDAYVIARACQQMARWNTLGTAGRELFVSANLSAKEIGDPELVDRVLKTVRRSSLPPRALKLEVTETVLVENAQAASKVMRALESRGIGFALDDFGTGYSALSYLHQFRFRTLKIDRSFIQRITKGERHAGLVRSIVVLARNLGMSVVAEGVETFEQWKMLQEIGCEYAQGFYFARPMPPADLERLLAVPSLPLAKSKDNEAA